MFNLALCINTNFRFNFKKVSLLKNNLNIVKSFKIFISGKIFRWFFKSNKINFNLNHGHKNIFFFKKNNIIKLYNSKYNNTLLFFKPINIKRMGFFCKKPRERGVFTGRGICTNYIYSKKLGKIAKYV